MKLLLNKLTAFAILNFIFLLFAARFILVEKPQIVQKTNSASIVSNDNVQTTVSTPMPAPVKDMFAELKNHNVKSDCWVSYGGHIYDITQVFGTHPGGDGIMLKYCGNDMTVGFDTKDKSPAIPHSANAASLLAQYLVQ